MNTIIENKIDNECKKNKLFLFGLPLNTIIWS
jgi:hypothetical protein